MKLGDLLNSLALMCNTNNDQSLIDFLSKSEVANTEISDGFAKALTSGLMSLDAAKNNPEVRSYFNAMSLNPIDTEVFKAAQKLGLNDENLTSLKEEKSTYKKFDLFTSFIDEYVKSQSGEGNPDKYKKMEAQYKELQQQIADERKKKDDALNESNTKHQQEVKKILLRSALMNKPYANKDIDQETQLDFVELLLNKELERKGASLVYDGKNLCLKQAENPDMDFYEDNVPVKFDDIINQTLANNKLLAVSEAQASNTSHATNPAPSFVSSGANGQQLNTSHHDAAVASALGDIK